MSLPAVAGNTIQASDLYQLCRPSGGTETGVYYLEGWGNAVGDQLGNWCPSQSRGATPVSVSIDVTINQVHTNSPSTSNLGTSGFRVAATTSQAATQNVAAGNFTIQY